LKNKWAQFIKKYENLTEKQATILFKIEEQLVLQTESNVLVMKYSEIIIQLGYIVLFAPAFPMAPFFSMMCNFIEIKNNLNNLSFYSKRFHAKAAPGIGSWLGIIEVSISI